MQLKHLFTKHSFDFLQTDKLNNSPTSINLLLSERVDLSLIVKLLLFHLDSDCYLVATGRFSTRRP